MTVVDAVAEVGSDKISIYCEVLSARTTDLNNPRDSLTEDTFERVAMTGETYKDKVNVNMSKSVGDCTCCEELECPTGG